MNIITGIYLFTLILCSVQTQESEPVYLMPDDFINSYRSEIFAIIIDTRKAKEFRKNRIEGAVNVDKMKTLELFADSLDHEIPLYLYCDGESRSNTAANYLIKNEFKTIYILRGGIREWKACSLPIDNVRKHRK